MLLFPPLPLPAEIYRSAAQRQIAAQPEAQFGPSSAVEPIRVLPTQDGRQAQCCQSI